MTSTPPLPPRPDELERQLAELTAWRSDAPELWKRALETTQSAGTSREPWFKRLVARPIPQPAIAALLLVIVGVFAVAMFPSLGGSRARSRGGVKWAQSEAGEMRAAVPARDYYKLHSDLSAAATPANKVGGMDSLKSLSGGPDADGRVAVPESYEALVLPDTSSSQIIVKSRPLAQSDSDRQVVRKATIELASDDVRGTFAKAAHLISEAGGEYVENSSVTGEGKTAQATLTMRVAASRLGAVMTSLSELGKVKSQNTTGEDVTAQVVDLESRVRNEQRVEQELLQLLEKRTDAPLKDILELRNSLSEVRGSIERMVGQREKLGWLVSLSSVLVVIRTADAPEKPPEKSGMGAYFSKAVAASWRNGLEFLADTVAAGVALIVGGLVWWGLLALAVFGVMRWRRRLAARCV